MNWLSDNYKWLFDGVAGAATLGILAVIFRWLFRSKPSTSLQSTNNSAALTASPHIEQHVYIAAGAQTPTETQPQLRDAESASLSPLRAREVLVHENSAGIWYEASTNLERARKAIVLPFKNVPKPPGQRTPRANDVSSSLVFRNADGSDEMHINHGVWLGRYEYSATFNSGVTHELLVALKDVPFVTFENPNAYNPFHQRHFRSGMTIHPPQMKTVHKEGTVEIILVDGHNVTMFHGVFEYQLSVEKMILNPKT